MSSLSQQNIRGWLSRQLQLFATIQKNYVQQNIKPLQQRIELLQQKIELLEQVIEPLQQKLASLEALHQFATTDKELEQRVILLEARIYPSLEVCTRSFEIHIVRKADLWKEQHKNLKKMMEIISPNA